MNDLFWRFKAFADFLWDVVVGLFCFLTIVAAVIGWVYLLSIPYFILTHLR